MHDYFGAAQVDEWSNIGKLIVSIFEILFYAQGLIVPLTIFVEPFIKLKLKIHFYRAVDILRCRSSNFRDLFIEDPELEK